MRYYTLLFFLISQFCFAQNIEIDSCGVNEFSDLNKYEVEYFNSIFSKRIAKNNFDFNGKKIAFAYGNFGNSIISKKEYYDRWAREYFKKGDNVYDQLYFLDSKEKTNSGGYDVIVLSWAKIGLNKKYKSRLIKKLGYSEK